MLALLSTNVDTVLGTFDHQFQSLPQCLSGGSRHGSPENDRNPSGIISFTRHFDCIWFGRVPHMIRVMRVSRCSLRCSRILGKRHAAINLHYPLLMCFRNRLQAPLSAYSIKIHQVTSHFAHSIMWMFCLYINIVNRHRVILPKFCINSPKT